METRKILENDKFVWYSTKETRLSGEYLKMKGLENHYIAQAVSKIDGREEFVLLRADESGATVPVFASSQMSNVVEYIDALSETLKKSSNE